MKAKLPALAAALLLAAAPAIADDIKDEEWSKTAHELTQQISRIRQEAARRGYPVEDLDPIQAAVFDAAIETYLEEARKAEQAWSARQAEAKRQIQELEREIERQRREVEREMEDNERDIKEILRRHDAEMRDFEASMSPYLY